MTLTSVDRDEIRSVVRGYILSEFLPGESPDELSDTTPLITGGILDSIGSVKLVSFLEERFGVRFEAQEVSIDYLDTVELIVETVSGKMRS